MEPGLVSRTIVEQTDDHVVIREVWDLNAPGCPFVRMRSDAPSAQWMRELIFAPEEFKHRNPPMHEGRIEMAE